MTRRLLRSLPTLVVMSCIVAAMVAAPAPFGGSPVAISQATSCDEDGVTISSEAGAPNRATAVTVAGVDSVACAGARLVLGVGLGANAEDAVVYFTTTDVQAGHSAYRIDLTSGLRPTLDGSTGTTTGSALARTPSVREVQSFWVALIPRPQPTAEPIVTPTPSESATPTPTPTPTQTPEPQLLRERLLVQARTRESIGLTALSQIRLGLFRARFASYRVPLTTVSVFIPASPRAQEVVLATARARLVADFMRATQADAKIVTRVIRVAGSTRPLSRLVYVVTEYEVQ